MRCTGSLALGRLSRARCTGAVCRMISRRCHLGESDQRQVTCSLVSPRRLSLMRCTGLLGLVRLSRSRCTGVMGLSAPVACMAAPAAAGAARSPCSVRLATDAL